MEQAQDQPDRRCRHCGTALTDETTGGLCPRCLLEMNFASRTMPGGEPSPQVPPPSAEQMAVRFPQFEILECLGRGGMGIVYKARQKTLDRLVAIKVLAGERRDDPQFKARFSREARTLAKLSHPNIVTVHDFGESDGMFYLVMEFVDGVNLRDVLRDGRMEPAQALAIVPEICEALQFAHDHGVVHRDIKPENILMDRNGRVKIADFGIAALVGAAAERSGTPPYMAPEQEAAHGVIDHRADIYALGVVFYEMLTGERPEQDPSRPSHRVEVDVRLDEIVLRALEKEPARRYQTAGDFRTVVETVAGRGSGPANVRQAAADVGGAVKWRRFFAPLVVVRNGERVIHWPGVVRDSLLLAGIYSVAWLLAVAVLSPLLGTPPPVALFGGIIGFLIAMLGFGFYRSFKTPVDRLRHADQRPSDDESKGDNRNRWELIIILAGTLFFVLFSAFTWEWTGPLRVPLIAISALGMAICVLSLAGVWPFPSPIFPVPNFSSRNLRRRWLRVLIFGGMGLAAVLVALLFWLQRPQMIDEPNIAATSPDGMYDAMGQTWHTMRVFGGDRTFYRFIVQGRAGAVWERWEVEVPYDRLATSYLGLSNDDILFGKHGFIAWSEDGKRASFRVNGVEVAGFDTETGKPTGPGGAEITPEQVARAFMEAFLSGDVDKARSLLGPPISDHRPDHLAKELSNSEDLRLGSPSFETWHVEDPYAVTRLTFTLPGLAGDHVSCMVLRRSGESWRVVEISNATAHDSLADELGRFRQSLEDENRPPLPPDEIVVDETALHLLVAIRGKDEAKMRELCIDRTKGWTDAMVGHFSMELRESFRQKTGEEFALYPGKSLVTGDLAVVKCRAANEAQKKLNGNILVLHFCRTEAGWKNWTARNAMDSQPVAEHLAQARKWAAEWEDAPSLPEPSGNSLAAPAFGPVMEATLASRSKGGAGSYLDLETGRQMTPPKMRREASLNTELGTWARKGGVDGTIWLYQVDDIVVDGAFQGIDVLAMSAPDHSWKTMTAAELKEQLDREIKARNLGLPCTSKMKQRDGSHKTIVWLIKTREGSYGMLQIVGFTDTPPGVKLRYKLVREERPSS